MLRRFATAVPSSASVRQRVVLVVEDDRSVRRIECEVLAQEGWTVVEAARAEDALALAAAHRGELDILVTDLSLPGLRGCELAARLLRETPWLGVVFTSGYPDDDGLVGRFPGAVFLQKPFTLEALTAAVDAVSARVAA